MIGGLCSLASSRSEWDAYGKIDRKKSQIPNLHDIILSDSRKIATQP